MTSFLAILKDLQQNLPDSSQNDQQIYREQLLKSQYKINEEPNVSLRYIDPLSSHMQYFPFSRKVIDFQKRRYKQKVPRKRKQKYQVLKVYVQQVPRQVIGTDYYVIQHIRYYQKQVILYKTIDYVPVVRTRKKIQYIPVERKIIHYPEDIERGAVDIKAKNNVDVNCSVYCSDHQGHYAFQQNQSLNKKGVQEGQFSSLRQQPMVESLKESQDLIDQEPRSILISLSKAYSPQPSTSNDQKYSENYISRFLISQFIPLKPTQLKQMNYRSTQTIQNPYLFKPQKIK